MKSIYLLAACLLLITGMPAANGQTVLKEKKFSGHFPASRGKLVIDNRYGKLTISTWDKNEVTVNITVTAKGTSSGHAQQLLDRISITEPPAQGSGIHYKTVIGNSTVTGGEFRIDYVVSMPRSHAAAFINKHGDIDLADMQGKLEIDLEYGSLKTAGIRGTDKDIRVGFGSATIPSIEAGSIRLLHSNLAIGNAGTIRVANQNGNTTINASRFLDIDQKYGDLRIGSANQLKGTVQYASMTVDKLLKSVQLTIKYCTKAAFSYIGPEVSNIDVDASFSNLSYDFDRAASLSAEMTVSFGNVSSDWGASLNTGAARPGQAVVHRIKIGGGQGTMKLNVGYGNIALRRGGH